MREGKQSTAESRRWHAAIRRRDAEDVASGRLVATAVTLKNSFIRDAPEWKDENLGDVLYELYEEDDALEHE